VQLSTRREVALKLVAHGAVASRRSRLRFDREVELAARLEHPSIARVYDSGMGGGVYFYAMELVEGRQLDQYVREQGPEAAQVVSLMREVCLAVQHAHQRGVIHRDLKPSNVLVTREGVPKVLDFGLAKALDDAQDALTGLTLTLEGQFAGTPAFMAPEQASGDGGRRIDTRTDVYGLGATLYLLLTGGHTPHETSGPRLAVLRRIVEEEPRPPRRFDPRRIDRDLEAICSRRSPVTRTAVTSLPARWRATWRTTSPAGRSPRVGPQPLTYCASGSAAIVP
jgi:serine/threonine protein kinase